MTKKNQFYLRPGFLLILLLIMSITLCTRKDNATMDKKRNGILVDKLENAEIYFGLHPAFKEAFAFLNRTDLAALPAGRHEINGDLLVANVSIGMGRSREESKLEVHRNHIDIQYIVSGTDEMGWSPLAQCDSIFKEYDSGKDVIYFNELPKTWTTVPAGSFAVFFPEDAHAPKVSEGEIHKIVIKVKLDQ